MLIIENPIEPNLRNTRDFEMTIFAHSVHRHSFVKKKLHRVTHVRSTITQKLTQFDLFFIRPLFRVTSLVLFVNFLENPIEA